MRALSRMMPLMVTILLCGCSILSPGKKEFFQKEVPAYPERVKLEEKTRAAVDYVRRNVDEAYEEGLKADVTNSVMSPLHNAKIVLDPVSSAVGHPSAPIPPYANPTNVAAGMEKLLSNYEGALTKLETKLGKLEGKDIEGTGAIQMSYVTYILILVVIAMVLWVALKIAGTLYPPVAIGTSIVSGGAQLLRRGFGEVIEAGEVFKKKVQAKIDDPATQQKVLDLFRSAHLETQSRDVQNVIKAATASETKEIAKALNEHTAVQ